MLKSLQTVRILLTYINNHILQTTEKIERQCKTGKKICTYDTDKVTDSQKTEIIYKIFKW